MAERARFEGELEDLGIREYWGVPAWSTPPPTVGFEFDVHFGVIEEVVTGRGKTMPDDSAEVTKHTEADDFFRVKRDGQRLEISTKPFTVDAAGKKELEKAILNIGEFAGTLKKGCENAKEVDITVPGVRGKPKPFTLPVTIEKDLPIVRLPVGGRFHPTNCMVWAAPQATITVTLGKVRALVQEIWRSEGSVPGFALTGPGLKIKDVKKRARMGVRSDALYRALWGVDKLWKDLAAKKPRIMLSDKKTEVNATTLSEDLRGLLILLVSYLWSGELRYNYPPPGGPGKDYEPFPKAYLPINVKAPFSEIFREAPLTDTERLLFREVFAVKGEARDRLFRVARPGVQKPDGTRLLFPTGPKETGEDSVHKRQKRDFGTAPTWDDLIDHTLDKNHKGWGDRLMVASYRSGLKPVSSASKIIGMDKTGPRIALELRRIGFEAVFSNQWAGLMRRIFEMTEKLDA